MPLSNIILPQKPCENLLLRGTGLRRGNLRATRELLLTYYLDLQPELGECGLWGRFLMVIPGKGGASTGGSACDELPKRGRARESIAAALPITSPALGYLGADEALYEPS